MTDGELRTLRIIHIAMILGVTFFAAVVIFVCVGLPGPAPAPRPAGFTLIDMMAASAAVVSLAAWGGGQLLYTRQMTSTDPATSPATRLRTATLIRLFLFEAATFFSLVGLLVTGISGALAQTPAYWLLLIPYGVQVWLVMKTFPARAVAVLLFLSLALAAPVHAREKIGQTLNKRVVQTYMDGFNAGDHKKILACLTDDVEWILPGGVHLKGKAAFDKEIENPAFVGRPVIKITRYTEENNVVVAEGSVTCAKKDGGRINLVFSDIFVMKNGLVESLTSFLMDPPKEKP